LDLNKNKD
jgi:predicted phosphodiesterase